MSLFAEEERDLLGRAQPLASRMRPLHLHEFVGQQHVLGEGQLLRRLIDADRVGSLILFGPPGTGKTTLAHVIAQATQRHFAELSAVLHGVKDLRELLEAARQRMVRTGQGTVLFIDEIHRFNRAQQDAVLADVEQGVVTLIGATTSNPFFAVSGALISRSQVIELKPLSETEIVELLQRALQDRERGLGRYDVVAEDDALQAIARACGGDARQALSTLEVAVLSHSSPLRLDCSVVQRSLAHRAMQYDKTGDEHFDCASALIKSIRGSDPDAGLYWLARMLEGGEDVRFLARRLVILASEDVGNADPQALILAVACQQACEFVGLPECQFALAQTVSYLACAPKSNAATLAIGQARRDVREQRLIPVPKHLQDAHYQGAKRLDRGAGYQYSHDEGDGVAAQDYLGVDRTYYQPVDRGFEAELAERLLAIRVKLSKTKESGSGST